MARNTSETKVKRANLSGDEKTIPSETTRTPTSAASDAAPPKWLGRVLARKAFAERGLSLRSLSDITGLGRSTLGAVLNSDARPSLETRNALEVHLGIPAASWDQLNAPQAPTSAISPIAPPESTEAEAPAIDVCRANLSAIRAQLKEPSLSEQGRIRLLGLETGAARLLGKLTGELDESDLLKFKQSPEYRDLLRRLIGAISPCKRCTDEVIRVVGMTAKPIIPVPKNRPLDRQSLAEACKHTEEFVSTDDLFPATDDLIYPVAERERELVREDVGLARRVFTCLKTAEPVLSVSKLDNFSNGAAANYRRKVTERLSAELELDEMLSAFCRDFGAIAADRVHEIVEKLETIEKGNAP
jgi:transcriptional regulator with XRE-family HTH domain